MTATASSLEPILSASDVLTALEASGPRPDEALRAGVDHAAEIAPTIIAVVERAASRAELSERDANLLFWGVHVLAAARRTELYRPFLRLLRTYDERELDRLLGDATTTTLAAIVISVFDGDAGSLIEACADRDLDGFARWNLFGAIARLTFDGAIPHATTLAFLERFDRDALAEPDDVSWMGWEDTIVFLGLEEMRERLVAACREGRFTQSEVDLDEALTELSVARNLAAGDDSLFVRQDLVPIGDPVEALTWVDELGDDDTGGDTDSDIWEPDDPAAEFALNEEEIAELQQFLRSRPAGVTVMSLEAIDGYYAALVMDTNLDRMRHAAAQIFTSEASPYFDNRDQEKRIAQLLMRHLKTIATRLSASYEHDPILDESAEPTGRVWATGFIEGMQVATSEWEAYISADEVTEFLSPFLVLSLNDGEERDGVRMTAEQRAAVIPLMPVSLLGLYAAVRQAEEDRKRQPVRSTKVGRNEPCPCGSGKKFKRCCGSSDRRVS